MAHADPLAALPDVKINLSEAGVGGYAAALNWAHGRDVHRAGAGGVFHGVPMTTGVAGWRRINLLHDGYPTVSLVVDETDGYLIGFRRGGDGAWLRFRDKALPMGVHARPLQIDSSYRSLISDDERQHFTVGKQSLISAYHVLVNYDEWNGVSAAKMRQQRKALALMIVMFCEASRLTPVLDFLCWAMATDYGVPMDINLWTWITNWSTISRFALHCRAREAVGALQLDPREVGYVQPFGITTADQVIAVLRLILHTAAA